VADLSVALFYLVYWVIAIAGPRVGVSVVWVRGGGGKDKKVSNDCVICQTLDPTHTVYRYRLLSIPSAHVTVRTMSDAYVIHEQRVIVQQKDCILKIDIP
jgi:hypothetical protein